jgi:hypothetical protein
MDTCQYTLMDVFGDRPLVNVPHQKGIRWLTEVFSRIADKFPHLTALQIPHTGESVSFAELDARAESVAAALSPFSSQDPTRSWPWPCRKITGKSWPRTWAFSRLVASDWGHLPAPPLILIHGGLDHSRRSNRTPPKC